MKGKRCQISYTQRFITICILGLTVLCSPASSFALASYKKSKSSAGSDLGNVVIWIFSHLHIVLFGICILCIIWAVIRAKRMKVQDGKPTFSVSMTPVRTVYDEQQRVYRQEVISDTSNGRMIDGHPLRTREDWDRWSKYDHEARDCADIIRKCERELESKYCQDPEASLRRAKDAYARYERLCTTYGMWNNLIQDHAYYVPTAEQKQRSKQFLDRLTALVPAAIEQKQLVDKSREIALAYLESLPGKTAYRTDMTRQLSSEMEITPSEAGKLLRILYNLDVLREAKNDQGRIIVRKARKKTNSGQ